MAKPRARAMDQIARQIAQRAGVGFAARVNIEQKPAQGMTGQTAPLDRPAHAVKGDQIAHAPLVPQTAHAARAIAVIRAGQPLIIEQLDLRAQRHIVMKCIEHPPRARIFGQAQNPRADAFEIVDMEGVKRAMRGEKFAHKPRRDGIAEPLIHRIERIMRGGFDRRIDQGKAFDPRIVIDIARRLDARFAIEKPVTLARRKEVDLDPLAGQQFVNHIAQIGRDPAARHHRIVKWRPVVNQDFHRVIKPIMRLKRGVKRPKRLAARLPWIHLSSAIRRVRSRRSRHRRSRPTSPLSTTSDRPA